MDLLGLAEFTAVYALRNWAPFLFDLYERTSFVVAGRGPMAYPQFATGVRDSVCAKAIATQRLRTFNAGRACILHRTDEYLTAGKLDQRGFRFAVGEMSGADHCPELERGVRERRGGPKQHAKACVIGL